MGYLQIVDGEYLTLTYDLDYDLCRMLIYTIKTKEGIN